MIDIPYEQAVQALKDGSGLSSEEIEAKIQEKLEQLSGLISKDGAVHILANELGVQLVAPVPVGANVKIKDLSLKSRNITVTGRLIKKYEVRSFDKNGRQGKVASLLLGDETGLTRLVFWNDQVPVFEELKEQDILVVKNPFVKQSYQQDRLELQLNDQSTLTVNPDGVTVEQRASPERAPRVQKYIKDLQGGEDNIEVIATVVQVYDPRFYDACSECRRKLIGNLCPEHGEVKADINFNMSLFLDDGTGNIRTSLWRNQALVLTGKTEQQFQHYRDNPMDFEEVKNELLGEIIKVVGTVKRNDTFDRLEMTAQLVFTDVDPAAELANLEQKFGKEPAPKTETKVQDGVSVAEEIISLDDLEEMGK